MNTIKDEKKMLRTIMKGRVARLSEPYCKASDEAIKGYVLSLPEYEAAHTIICYVGTAAEINTMPILEAAWQAGKQVGVPLCTDKGVMEMRQIQGPDDLQDGFYGIKEPRENTAVIAPERIDLALIPCLTCNKQGQRLGYGGGYYDRYLERVACPKAILCREQVMQEIIPVEDHDQLMDIVVSEAGIIRIKRI